MLQTILTILGLALALVAFNLVCFYSVVYVPSKLSEKKKAKVIEMNTIAEDSSLLAESMELL